MTAPLTIPGIPFELASSAHSDWHADPEGGTIRVIAPPRSDVFVDPGRPDGPEPEIHANAATLLGPLPSGDFQFSARISVDFATTYDAGVLLLWIDERHWGKLCFELSPDGEPMIVSVVCRDVADDANAFVIDGQSVWLRVSRTRGAFAYHASLDGETWRLIRHFALDESADAAAIGFEAQSPLGDGCAVTIQDIRFTTARLDDIRDGS